MCPSCIAHSECEGLQVYTQLPSVRDGEVHAFANGEYKDAQQDVDMVFFFDGKSLRMERLAASVTGLQYVLFTWPRT